VAIDDSGIRPIYPSQRLLSCHQQFQSTEQSKIMRPRA